MTVYSIRTEVGGYRVVKFDFLLNVEKIYHIRGSITNRMSCDCPQSRSPSCKHRIMVLLFNSVKRIDTGWFYDWDSRRWSGPVSDEWKLLKQRLRRDSHD